MPRHTHYGSFVVIRRKGFSNDQWQAAGAQLLRIHYDEAGYFSDDRSTFVFPEKCIQQKEKEMRELGKWMKYDHRLESALREFPRSAFDYVWLVDVPNHDMKRRTGLRQIWRSETSVLYQVDHSVSDPSAQKKPMLQRSDITEP
jgi:hypothetical protein